MKIDRKVYSYNDFLLEKEFNNIIYNIYRMVESIEYSISENQDRVNVGDTITWDFPIKDPEPVEFTWDFEQKSKYNKIKDKLDLLKNKFKKFGEWVNNSEDELELKFEHPLINMVREFLNKLKDGDQIKKYFYKLVDEVSSLPYPIKKQLLLKLTALFIASQSFVSINDLATDDIVSKEPLMSEIKKEISDKGVEKTLAKDTDKKITKSEKAKFDKAQNIVKSVEGGYSGDRKDTGNYIEVIGGKRFLGTNHGISAPILLKYFRDNGIKRLPTRKDMEDLSYEKALSIYKKDYWDKQKLGDFESQSIANILYDGCVNQGPSATLEVLKKSLNSMGISTDDINSWNDLHQKLINQINNLSERKDKKLFDLIKKFRLERYKEARTYSEHGEGWKNRLDDLSYVENGNNYELS